MHFKLTNFYLNNKTKTFSPFLLFIFNFTLLATPTYKIELDESIKNNDNLEINIYISSEGDSSFVLTSY